MAIAVPWAEFRPSSALNRAAAHLGSAAGRNVRLTAILSIILIFTCFAAATGLQMRRDYAHALAMAASYADAQASVLAAETGRELDRLASLGIAYVNAIDGASAAEVILSSESGLVLNIAIADADGGFVASMMGRPLAAQALSEPTLARVQVGRSIEPYSDPAIGSSPMTLIYQADDEIPPRFIVLPLDPSSLLPDSALGASALFTPEGLTLALGTGWEQPPPSYVLRSEDSAEPALRHGEYGLKDYGPVIFSFVVGLTLSATCAILLRDFGAEGYVTGFTLGIALTLFMVLGRTLGEFRATLAWPRNFLAYFRAFWPLALTAFAYNAGIWIDKWIFWMSPSFAIPIRGIPTYPPYDGAMFYAHLTLAPGLAVFFALIETGFYTCYRRFYWVVQNHGTLGEIEEAQKDLEANAANGMRILLILHLAIAVATLLLAPTIAELLSLMPTQIGIFRFAVVGTAAHVIFLYALILLAYFDLRRRALVLASLFLVLNAVLTLGTQYLGYPYFGAGYFLAALISAATAFALAQREFKRLRYLTFVGNNPATGRSL